MKCICLCVKPEKIADCACPVCVDMDCEVRALRNELGCSSCKDDAQSSAWLKAVSSTAEFADHASCAKKAIPEMRRSGHDEDFYMRPFECCVRAGDVDGVTPCEVCTIDNVLAHGECECFSERNLSKPVVWLKRQSTIEGKNHDIVTTRLRSYKGTLRELLESVKARTKPYLHHTWLARFLRRQFHLDCDNYCGRTEVVILADFASAMILGIGFKATCESDATCNLYVVLVLHKVYDEVTKTWNEMCD